MKATKHTQTKGTSDNPRAGYYRKRNDHIVSFTVDDLDLKRKIKAAAEADNRSVNSWIAQYILPKLESELKAQEAKQQKGRG